MKKTVSSFFIFSLILANFLAIPFTAKAEGSLLNPGFEEAGAVPTKANNWNDFQNGYIRVKDYNAENWNILLENTDSSQMSGAYQRIDLNQSTVQPVYVGARVRGNNIVLASGGYFGASIYAEIYLQDGTIVYWNSEANKGTFSWRNIGFNTASLPSINQPISFMYVVPILAQATGQAYFDDVVVEEYTVSAGAVTLMFDDGETSAYNLGKPELDKYGFTGSAAIITNVIGEDGYMGWDELKDLKTSGWEIVSHSLSHQDLTALSTRVMVRELARSKRILNNQGLEVKNFAYPYGAYNDQVKANAALQYRSARAYELGDNPVGVDPMDIKVRSVENFTTVSDIQNWLDQALNNGRWEVLVFHRISEVGDDTYYVTPEMFTQIIKAVADSGVSVVTYDQGLDQFAAN